MKRALFLHGTNGDPSHHWWPWLKNAFEKAGYTVWAPSLPDNSRPNEKTYWKFLNSVEWDFNDNVLVGHSSGATSILNLLSHSEFPTARAAVLVGAFLNERLTSKLPDFEKDQFLELFPSNGFDFDLLKEKADKFYFVHGDDDPYCAYEDTLEVAKKLEAEVITIQHGGHLSTSFGITELPQLTSVLQRDGILNENN